MRAMLVLIGASWLATPLLAQDHGLKARQAAADQPAPSWQARLERDSRPLTSRVGTPLWLWAQGGQDLRLLGDYQFSSLQLGQTGGLRLTGGLLLQLRHSGAPGDASAPTSLQSGSGYAGVGYASGSASGDWGFSADLGLRGPAFGPGRANTARLGLGQAGPDLRTQPLLRLGMHLAF